MKKIVTGLLAASALTAAFAPALANERMTSQQGVWTYDFANEKVCRAIQVTAGSFTQGTGAAAVTGVTQVKVINTDNTSETLVLPATFTNANEAIYKALLAACDHADDNHQGDLHKKSYVISVTGTSATGLLPAVFGGVVGNLPTAGSPNAGTPGFIISVKVKTDN